MSDRTVGSRPSLDAAALRRRLVGDFVVALDVVEHTASTNADLATAARSGAPEGTVAVAEFQQAGRGRFARTWTSPPRAGVTFSMLLRPGAVPVARWGWLPLLAGVALVDAVRSQVPVGAAVALKWPNDLLLGPEGAKAAGILAEAGSDWIVLGMGVNVDNGVEELPSARAGSLRLAFPDHPVSREELLVAIVSAFAPLYRAWLAAAGDPAASGLRAVYEQACATLGRHVEVQRPKSRLFGVAHGIDETGALVVLVDGAHVSVSAGDVAHVRAVDR